MFISGCIKKVRYELPYQTLTWVDYSWHIAISGGVYWTHVPIHREGERWYDILCQVWKLDHIITQSPTYSSIGQFQT